MTEELKQYFLPNPAYFTYWYPATGYSKQKHQHREVTDAEIELHLTGKQGLGVSPFVDEENVKFGVIDIDKKDFSLVDLLIKGLVKLNIYPNVFQSKSKGFHIYIFPEKPIDAKIITYNLSKVITDDIAIEKTTDKNGNPLEKLIVELFPKQDKVTEKGGSKVNLPLFADQRPQLDFKGDVKDFGVFITPLKNFEDPQTKKSVETKISKKIKISETYPCIERVLQGVSEGERDEWGLELVRYMVYLKNPIGVINTVMYDWNAKNSPPLENREIEKLVRQGEKYAGKNAPDCNKPFVKMFCDREHCRKAKLVLCEDPLLMKKLDGYYMKDKKGNLYRVTNFTMEVISADKGIRSVSLKVTRESDQYVVKIDDKYPSWKNFMASCTFEGCICDHKGGVEFNILLAAELKQVQGDIEETDLVSMDFEMLLSHIEKEITYGFLSEFEKGVELTEGDIISGWKDKDTIYFRSGRLCAEKHLSSKIVAKILRDKGIKKKKLSPPIKGHYKLDVWVIKLKKGSENLLLDVTDQG